MLYDTYTAPATTSGCCGCGSCPACQSLQCLCRPRFFAGQLVTDADFRRLDDYLVGKDRLHNRYLHGTGVACGLEVVCSPCDDTITVRPGYALGPCGEDIVVCADTRVDVGGLIRAQRRSRAVDCGPFGDQPQDCDAAQQRWILGICYDEQPARGVASLTPARVSCGGSCGNGGGCGCGNGGCGCGSGGGYGCSGGTSSSTGSAATGSCGCGAGSPAPARAAVACEPTVICEGFRFTLTKEKPALTRNGAATPAGALATRVKACLTSITDRITQVPADPAPAELVDYCCQLKADLRGIIETAAVHGCGLGRRLADITCPDPSDKEAAQKAQQAISAMLAIAIDLYRDCLCSALLPPCPDDCADDCVPLATLTVRSSDLVVLDVCNWSSRRFAITLPMLGYWLGSLPAANALRQRIGQLCCPPVTGARFSLDSGLKVSAPQASPAAAERTASASEVPTILQVAAQYAEHTSPLAGLEATLLRGLGATGPDDAELASDAELADPFAALALARLLGPAAASLGAPLRDPTAAVLGRLAPAADTARLDALEREIADLRKTVNAQARTITTLRRRQQK